MVDLQLKAIQLKGKRPEDLREVEQCSYTFVAAPAEEPGPAPAV